MTSRVHASDIGIIILAAGSGKRFGSDKRQALLDNGKTLLESTLASIPATFTRRILVLRPGEVVLASQFSDNWTTCFAKDPDNGMASSLIAGIKEAASWEGALIGLADMPFISGHTYSKLQDTLAHRAIVIPTYQGKRGNPAGFRKEYFREILTMTGDQGARKLLARYQDQCELVETGDQGIIRDIDTPENIR